MWQTVWPIVLLGVASTVAKLTPIRVTLFLPVAGAFGGAIHECVGASKVKTCCEVPTTAVRLMPTTRSRNLSASHPVAHAMHVLLVHETEAHVSPPIVTVGVQPLLVPKLNPLMVVLVYPEATLLKCKEYDTTGESKVKMLDNVPTTRPSVMPVCKSRPLPSLFTPPQTIVLIDDHAVVSHVLS